MIEGDPTQIQQVLINLVRNAFDAMRDTPPSRRIVEIATNSNGDGTISASGAVRFFLKPFDDEKFLAAVHHALGERAGCETKVW